MSGRDHVTVGRASVTARPLPSASSMASPRRYIAAVSSGASRWREAPFVRASFRLGLSTRRLLACLFRNHLSHALLCTRVAEWVVQIAWMVYAGLEDAGPPSGPSSKTPYQSVKRDPNAYHGALDPNMGPPDAPQQHSLVKHLETPKAVQVWTLERPRD